MINGPVQVPPPCDCSNPIDIASFIAAHQMSNDDAAIGLSTTGLDSPPAADCDIMTGRCELPIE